MPLPNYTEIKLANLALEYLEKYKQMSLKAMDADDEERYNWEGRDRFLDKCNERRKEIYKLMGWTDLHDKD